MGQLIGKRYGKALFDIALSDNSIDSLSEEISVLRDVFSKEDMQKIMNHPQISSVQKMDLIEKSLKSGFSETILGLFKVLLEKNREAEFISVCDAFIDMVRNHKGITKAYVYTPLPLTDERTESIRQSLEKSLKKQVETECITDKSLIGGMKILVDGKVLDSSVKKQLDDLKKQLLGVSLYSAK